MNEEELWAKHQPDDILNAPAQPRSRAAERRRKKAAKLARTWAKIPHHGGLQLAKHIGCPALAVLLALEHIVHEDSSNRVKLTNDLLESYGIARQSKVRGLRQLAGAGVISIKWRGLGAPIVTHHWYTRSGELKKC